MPFKFKLGDQPGVCSYEVLNSKNKVLLTYNGEPCLQGMFMDWEGRYLNDIKRHPQAKKIRHDIRCKHAKDLPGLKLFVDYLFSKDSPYREYVEYFKVEYDEEDRPVSFVCEDIDAVHRDAFFGLAVSCRLAFENPGTGLLYYDAVNNGVHPGMAMFLINAVRYQMEGDKFNTNKYVASTTYQSAHGVINTTKPWNFNCMLDGIKFEKVASHNKLRNGGYLQAASYYSTNTNTECNLTYGKFFGGDEQYTGAFNRYYENYLATMSVGYAHYYKNCMVLQDLFNLLKKTTKNYINTHYKKAA